MDHPLELTFEQQLEDLIESMDTGRPSYGIALKVFNDWNCDPDCLSQGERSVWDKVIIPALRDQARRRDDAWRKELMEKD